MNPLVTWMCLTRNRREWLPGAIECFRRQTYANRELLIVADSGTDIAGVDVSGARVIVLGRTAVVGEKRNIACAEARGEIIAHGDDDDFSAPERLAAQVARIEAGKAVSGFHSMKFTDGSQWWQYRGGPTFALGTSLCYLRSWWESHPFTEMQCGQDEEFSTVAASKRQLISEDDLDLMYATIHPGNTSPRHLQTDCWTPLPGYRWQDAR